MGINQMTMLYTLVLLGCFLAPSMGQFGGGLFNSPFGGGSSFFRNPLARDPFDSFFDDPNPLLTSMRRNYNFAACLFSNKSSDAMGMGNLGSFTSGISSPMGGSSGEVSGRIDFRQRRIGGPVTMRLDVENLPWLQNGQRDRALNILEFGDCSNPGRHFDPMNRRRHGPSTSSLGHAGDLGNFVQDGSSIKVNAFSHRFITLRPGQTSIIGRSLVINMGRDDEGRGMNEESRRNGNSGPIVACCSIGLASGESFFPRFNNRNQQQQFGNQGQWNPNGNGQNQWQNQGQNQWQNQGPNSFSNANPNTGFSGGNNPISGGIGGNTGTGVSTGGVASPFSGSAGTGTGSLFT